MRAANALTDARDAYNTGDSDALADALNRLDQARNDALDASNATWELADPSYLDQMPGTEPMSLNEWLELDGSAEIIEQFSPELDLSQLWDSLTEGFNDLLDSGINTYNQFLNLVAPRDPLALDLDGDGIETLAANGYGGVLFDQNGDGIKRATGWVAPDDGLLVLDRNGNGTIDNGSELFGNNTPTAGGTASNGLAALADLDTNADGQINASDAQFANLQVWRDLNSDGISQSNELFTLNDLGISSLNTGGTLDVNTDLGNGNSIINDGSFTWADGSTGSMADLALQQQNAYRQFTDNIPISTAAAALPDVVATGSVRDLREAMSMSGNIAASNDAVFCYNDNDIKLAVG